MAHRGILTIIGAENLSQSWFSKSRRKHKVHISLNGSTNISSVRPGSNPTYTLEIPCLRPSEFNIQIYQVLKSGSILQGEVDAKLTEEELNDFIWKTFSVPGLKCKRIFKVLVAWTPEPDLLKFSSHLTGSNAEVNEVENVLRLLDVISDAIDVVSEVGTKLSNQAAEEVIIFIIHKQLHQFIRPVALLIKAGINIYTEQIRIHAKVKELWSLINEILVYIISAKRAEFQKKETIKSIDTLISQVYECATFLRTTQTSFHIFDHAHTQLVSFEQELKHIQKNIQNNAQLEIWHGIKKINGDLEVFYKKYGDEVDYRRLTELIDRSTAARSIPVRLGGRLDLLEGEQKYVDDIIDWVNGSTDTMGVTPSTETENGNSNIKNGALVIPKLDNSDRINDSEFMRKDTADVIPDAVNDNSNRKNINGTMSRTTERVLWLCGAPGAGHSRIVNSVAFSFKGLGRLASTFVFSEKLRKPTIIFRYLLYELALFSESLFDNYKSTYKEQLNQMTLYSQAQIIEDLLRKENPLGPILIIIDGLDEKHMVGEEDDRRNILEGICYIAENLSKEKTGVKMILCSNEDGIAREAFEKLPDAIMKKIRVGVDNEEGHKSEAVKSDSEVNDHHVNGAITYTFDDSDIKF